MVRSMKVAALVSCAMALSAGPVLAQDLSLPGLDLDPFHIFTPAPAPAASAAVPAPHHAHHHHYHHHHAAKH